jgi:two-component system, chemotaxis family, CheB/CheR fusion protein
VVSGRRVLVIDDHRLIFEYVSDVAETSGWTAEWASDGAAALIQLPKFSPSLILVDLQMPGVDGREFLMRLQSQLPDHGCAVVVMSGTYSRHLAQEMESLGVMAVLHKPVPVDDLKSLFEAVAGIADGA